MIRPFLIYLNFSSLNFLKIVRKTEYILMNGILGSLPCVFRKMFLHLLHDSTFLCFRNWLALQSLDMFSIHCITDFSLESRFDLIVVQFPNISHWFVMLGLNCNRSSIFIPSTEMHHHFGSWFTVSLSLFLSLSQSYTLTLWGTLTSVSFYSLVDIVGILRK